jgi:hypothetical protein
MYDREFRSIDEIKECSPHLAIGTGPRGAMTIMAGRFDFKGEVLS